GHQDSSRHLQERLQVQTATQHVPQREEERLSGNGKPRIGIRTAGKGGERQRDERRIALVHPEAEDLLSWTLIRDVEEGGGRDDVGVVEGGAIQAERRTGRGSE